MHSLNQKSTYTTENKIRSTSDIVILQQLHKMLLVDVVIESQIARHRI